MFYYLHTLQEAWSALRVFRYVTVRTVGGAGTAFAICVLAGPPVIRWLQRCRFGQVVRKEEAPPLYLLHSSKEGTPTMGGILIIGAIVVSTLVWAVPTNPLVWLVLATLVYMGLVGLWDDLVKISGRHSRGLPGRVKLLLEILWVPAALAALLALPETRDHVRSLMVPFIKVPAARLGLAGAALFVGVVLIGASNAVNLTDGLDGLAIGCSSSVAMSYAVLAYVAGHAAFAEYLLVPYVRGAGELAVFCGCMAGACLGFLWYNCHPARVFMGDTGSLALGGAIAMTAVVIKQELALVIVGGVFVIEAVSVIVQVVSFKLRGKRVFAMAPLHHHFEMKQWSETQVTVRFWILSIIFALLGVLTLKIR
ncbi:MAG: phospho-N-acetylmuramoyl-pentapeptide-transferase [Lentisphaerae bacterium]|nr:phospho-N-acetylmuramoyl-pentapeptide-transferase [Lentisphaerota bacterium]